MLDWAHTLVLRAVASGDHDDSPALRTLVASGLVEQLTDGGYRITSAGQVALEDGEPKRWERVVWPVVGVAGAAYVAITVIDWVT